MIPFWHLRKPVRSIAFCPYRFLRTDVHIFVRHHPWFVCRCPCFYFVCIFIKKKMLLICYSTYNTSNTAFAISIRWINLWPNNLFTYILHRFSLIKWILYGFQKWATDWITLVQKISVTLYAGFLMAERPKIITFSHVKYWICEKLWTVERFNSFEIDAKKYFDH